MAMRKVQAALHGKPQRFYWKHKAADGGLVDTEVHLRGFHYKGEDYVIATMKDITETRRKDEEARELFHKMESILERRTNELVKSQSDLLDERQYRTRVERDLEKADRELNKVFETSGDGLVVVDMDQNILKVNRAYCELTGYEQADIQEAKCYEVFTCKGCTGRTCKATTLLRSSDKAEYETECVNSQGEVVPCIVSATALKDSQGETMGMIQTYRNISAYKRWVNELKHSEELHRVILSSISDAVFITDDEGCLFYVSPSVQTVFGYTTEEVWWMDNIRRLLGDFYSSEQFGRDGEIRNLELSLKDKHGQPRDLMVTVQRVRIRNGTVLISCREITEKKAAEEEARIKNQQLEQAGKMVSLGILVSGVAHEINNPNNFIMLNAPLLSRMWEDARDILDAHLEENGDFMLGRLSYARTRDRIPELFEGVNEGARRIKTIVADMKRYVRQEAGNMDQTVYLNSVIKHALTLLNNQIKNSTLHFEVDYSQTRPRLTGNFQKVEQVVINLIQNACEALPDVDCALRVRTVHDPGANTVSIVVEDEGVGIATEHLEHIMDPFFTTRRSCGGLGLGLSISQRIVKDHGGRLVFTSVPGEGARAEALFPAADSMADAGEDT